ncbi:MAG: AMP-binding protein, partial [bacterium]|nr:AMP-binding protein [bacterium]
RHESLRTSFIMMEKEPVQHIHDKVEFKISTGRGPYNSFISNFVRPFDLSRAPLMRAGLVEVADGKSLLMVDMHHIISDGISMEIFKDELTALYGHKELPPLPVQYKDFTQWQAGEKEKEKIEVQREYWLNKFTGDRLTVLNLPYDYPRPPTMGHEGKIITFEFSPSLSRALRDLARGANTTLFVVLAALYKILLARLNGQEEEVVIGSPASGRRHPDLAPIIGMFVNTLVLQSFPRDGKIFREFLLEMKQVTLEAFENQEFQFEELVELLDVERQAGRNPLFDVMFALDTIPTDKQENSGLTLIPYKYHHPVSKVDMILTGEEKEGVDESMDRLFFTLEYSTRLFKQDTVQRYTRYFKRIASAVITNPGDKIGAIEIISPGEKREILYDFNDTETNYPSDRTIQQLFAEQADKTPHAVSLVHMTNRSYMTHMTYARLNEESNRLAHLLIERGVASETIVGIMVEHSIEMPVGIIAILKAGGAYLPINPKNPAKRIKYMLDDSGAGLLLTQKRFTGSLEIPAELDVMVLEDDNLYPAGKENLKFRGIAGSLAYVIYTSGSTGNPKGVPITHSNFSPLVHWGYKHLGFGTADRVIRNLSYFFDWSVWEIFLTLTSGSSLYLAPEEEVLNPAAMVDFIRENSITVLHITPTQFRALIDMGEGSVKLGTLTYLCIGAEKLTYDLAKRSFETVSDDCRVFNMYGPTEAAIISAVLELDRDDEQKYRRLSGIPIGAPIANHKLIISDRYMNMCPVGVPGELYISGDGVTQGYLNRPELTA